MAEFCYECFCEFYEVKLKRKELLFSDEPELCEGCGECKPVVVVCKKDYVLYKLRYLIYLLKIVSAILLLPIALPRYFFIKQKYKKGSQDQGFDRWS